MTKRAPHAGLWKKGQSGNPLGRRVERPQINVLRELCRQDTDEVYKILMNIIRNEDERGVVRVNGIKFHQESAWGKAEQSLKLETTTAETVDPSKMTAEQIHLFVSGKTEEFLRNMYASGALATYAEKFKSETEAPEPQNERDEKNISQVINEEIEKKKRSKK